MTTIIGLMNVKGGVSKSTNAINLAYGQKERGYTVAVIDLEPQQTSYAWGQENQNKFFPVFSALGLITPKQIIEMAQPYDWVFLDCSRNDIRSMMSGMRASKNILIPCSPSPEDIRVSGDMVDLTNSFLNSHKEAKASFLITRKRPKTNLGNEVRLKLEALYGLNVLETEQHERVAYQTSWGEGGTVFQTHNKEAKNEVLKIGKNLEVYFYEK